MDGKNLAAAGLILALLAPTHLEAQGVTPRELELLPAYCRHVGGLRDQFPGGTDPAQIERWASIMGPESAGRGSMLMHMHHYCSGLIHTNYAKLFARNAQERSQRLLQSIGEFDYVIDRAPETFALLPEILTKKGENLFKLGQASAATAELQRAMKLKPDYWPPYAALSDYYQHAGNPKMARELLQQGLSASPDAAALKRRLAELDSGKGKRKAAPEPGAKAE